MTVLEMYDFMKKMIDEGHENALVMFDECYAETSPPEYAYFAKGEDGKEYVNVG